MASMGGGPDSAASRRELLRALNRATGRRIVVFDDDPTGSQSVHGAAIITVPERAELVAGLAEAGATCFVLTNTRSLDGATARVLNDALAREVFALEGELGAPIEIVSRSDSTLRGHVHLELETIDTARREELGEGFDAFIFAPAFIEAGRTTAGDVHYARLGGADVPVGETEFARDATFGYRSSNLRDFLVEVSSGALSGARVTSLSLEDLRAGGPERVAEVLGNVARGTYVVANATDFADLEVLALGALSPHTGRRFLFRSGPSLVRALSGNEPRPPLRARDLYPDGPPARHGLVVVGSHVGLTNAQLEVATAARDLHRVELDAAAIARSCPTEALVSAAADAAVAALDDHDVLLVTSRTLQRGADASSSLEIARAVSGAVVEVVRRVRAARPGFVLTKGGITSHDVAVHALEIRRATVLGQLLTGMVSVFRPVEAAPEAIGMPFVVFAGNVGDTTTLERVIGTLRGEQ